MVSEDSTSNVIVFPVTAISLAFRTIENYSAEGCGGRKLTGLHEDLHGDGGLSLDLTGVAGLERRSLMLEFEVGARALSLSEGHGCAGAWQIT